MALNKENIQINFAKGLDTKTDDKQVPLGNFLALQNSVFTKAGLLQKRNGYGALSTLSDLSSTVLTTFNGNLTAVGLTLQAYSQPTNTWIGKGPLQPVEVDVLPVIRNSSNQSQADSAVAANGLLCTVYTETVSGPLVYKYVIADGTTGQNITPPTVIPVSSGVVTGSPKVFLLGNYFVIVFTNIIVATPHLQFIAISTSNPSIVVAATDISAQYTNNAKVNFDGVVANNNLYLAWNGSDGGGAVRMTYIDSKLLQHNTVAFATEVATIMSLCADTSGGTAVIYANYWRTGSNYIRTLAVNQALVTILAPVTTVSPITVSNVTATATGGVCTLYYEVLNAYGFDGSVPTNYIMSKTVSSGGSIGSGVIRVRSVGLASKAFSINGLGYFLAAYQSPSQPTYFLMNQTGQLVAKLAYSNGGGYLTTGLPSVSVLGNTAQVPYLVKDLIGTVNKGTNLPAGTPISAVYSQTGINLATFTFGTSKIATAEIGSALHLSGGFLWMYDGYKPVEHGFQVYPDMSASGVTTSAAGGLITAQQYFYQFIYEWCDNQGNIHRSAPSLPVTITTTGATSSNTLNVPTLRLTYKTANPVKIVGYRWSVAQQTYYQFTSVTSPTVNDPTVDYVTLVDTLADTSILGNSILYTTGGVVENVAAPACSSVGLFKNRLVLVDAEDKNTLWFSKQVIQGVPVETSDLFTLYVGPTISGQGSSGPTRAIAALDDKLILFKHDAIYYVTGTGPDNTGANNDFSEPSFITGTVGSTNQQSIVFTPSGLLFESDKGIWLLGRDLSTTYVGAPVEGLTQGAKVLSAVGVPGTNQVRFTLDSGITLMYDYYFNQWGSFVNIPAISSCLYGALHTYVNSFGQVYQETPGLYLDGSSPVLMSFTTSWVNLGGLQGFERAYEFFLLGSYITPHKLSVQLAYDYNPSNIQSSTIAPDNYTPAYGGDNLYGGSSFYGGSGSLEQWRIFFRKQKCQSFQITVTEIYDSSFNIPAGAGFTLSGIDMTVGTKGTRPRLKASRQVG